MKERFTRNMGYVIVLFVIAIYFVISYLFVEGFNENPIVSIIDGVLISIGTIGLIKAIDSFDVEKGIRLATYASRCIDNAMLFNG